MTGMYALTILEDGKYCSAYGFTSAFRGLVWLRDNSVTDMSMPLGGMGAIPVTLADHKQILRNLKIGLRVIGKMGDKEVCLERVVVNPEQIDE